MNVAFLKIVILPEIHLIVMLIGCSFDCGTTWQSFQLGHSLVVLFVVAFPGHWFNFGTP